MYADRYGGPARARFNPGGLAAAIGINAAVIAALMVAAPIVTGRPPADPPLVTIFRPIDPPPPPEPKPADPRVSAEPRPAPPLDAPKPIVETPIDSPLTGTVDPLPPLPYNAQPGTGTATEAVPEPKPLPPPLVVGPAVDSRYAGDFQPDYPPSERRLGNEGKVTVRVLVGADGRVKQVERVSATSDAFFRVTEQRALSRWRFRAGTRDGVAEAAWRVMTVTFRMED